jgi:hypothetical protein
LFSSVKALLSTKKTAHNPLLRLLWAPFFPQRKVRKREPFAETNPLFADPAHKKLT